MKINGVEYDPGLGALVYGTLVWMSVAVGPWWVGLMILVTGCLINLGFYAVVRRIEKRRAYGGRKPG